MELDDFESNNPNQQRTIGGQIRTNKTSFKKQTIWFSRQKTNQKILRTARSVSLWIPHDSMASESKTNYPVASLKKPSHTWFPMLCIATTPQLFRVVKGYTCMYAYIIACIPTTPKNTYSFYLVVRRVYHGFNMFRWSLVQSRGTFEKSTLLRKVMLRDPLVPNTLSRMSSHFFAAV